MFKNKISVINERDLRFISGGSEIPQKQPAKIKCVCFDENQNVFSADASNVQQCEDTCCGTKNGIPAYEYKFAESPKKRCPQQIQQVQKDLCGFFGYTLCALGVLSSVFYIFKK